MKKVDNKPYIFCPLRKCWLILTPEEWVRQHVINYLHQDKKFSLQSLKPEHPVKVNELPQRIDLLLYHKAQPFILVECKRPKVAITQDTLDQGLRYNKIIQAKIIYLTNGIQHIVAHVQSDKIEFLQEIPSREDIAEVYEL